MSTTTDATFVQLINKNAGIAHRVCRIYFEETDDRDDAFQEMMYQLWKAFPAFGNRSKFSTWMYSVCLNTALTYRRKSRRQNAERLSEKHLDIAAAPGRDEEALADLFRAIGKLSPINKAVILLYLEEMSYDEIAEVTGISKSNVSVRLVRIKKELEDHMSRQNN